MLACAEVAAPVPLLRLCERICQRSSLCEMALLLVVWNGQHSFLVMLLTGQKQFEKCHFCPSSTPPYAILQIISLNAGSKMSGLNSTTPRARNGAEQDRLLHLTLGVLGWARQRMDVAHRLQVTQTRLKPRRKEVIHLTLPFGLIAWWEKQKAGCKPLRFCLGSSATFRSKSAHMKPNNIVSA